MPQQSLQSSYRNIVNTIPSMNDNSSPNIQQLLVN